MADKKPVEVYDGYVYRVPPHEVEETLQQLKASEFLFSFKVVRERDDFRIEAKFRKRPE